MNAPLPAVVQSGGLPMSAEQVRDQVNAIQKIMEAVMREGEHYGKVPGSKKPSLWKPGAEKLCLAFHIAPSFQIEDMSTPDRYRYRVRCIGTHQGSGVTMGEGIGSASSNEEKYKWRRAVCGEEFDATPESRRRTKYGKGDGGKVYTVDQVRAEPDDIDNTVLKMACKRALVAMCLNVTAASDIFTQDIEDLPDHLREADGDGDGTGEPKGREPVRQPQSKSGRPASTKAQPHTNGNGATKAASAGHIANIRNKLKAKAEELGHEDEAQLMTDCLKAHGIEALDGITTDQATAIQAWIKAKTE